MLKVIVNMEIGLLNNEDFEFLINLLSNNKGLSKSEFEILKSKHPYVVEEKNNPLIKSTRKHYGKGDESLNSFLLNRFSNKNSDIDFLYELTYNIGDYSNPHYDKKVVTQTTLILLSDNFEGGNLLIDGSDVGFNKKRMYINFEGSKQLHEIKPVEFGKRIVLVVMFNKGKQLL